MNLKVGDTVRLRGGYHGKVTHICPYYSSSRAIVTYYVGGCTSRPLSVIVTLGGKDECDPNPDSELDVVEVLNET